MPTVPAAFVPMWLPSTWLPVAVVLPEPAPP